MDEHDAIVHERLVYEGAGGGEVDEEVGIIHVLNANAEVTDARGRIVRGNGLGANGDDVGNASVRKRPRRNRGVDPAKSTRKILLEKVAVKGHCHRLTCPDRAFRL